MRHIVLDTETTGLDPRSGHRIVEIGCVELVGHIPTGRTFHHYLNPERDVPKEASAIHGLTDEFLKDKPLFTQIVGDFVDFIAEDHLVIHNAGFDMGFINAELERAGFGVLPMARAIDTVHMARKKFPGAPASLDALCKRFNIDLSARDFHGALLDARLLAEVYLELSGGRQAGLDISFGAPRAKNASGGTKTAAQQKRVPRVFAPSAEERAAHEKAQEKIKGSLWGKAE